MFSTSQNGERRAFAQQRGVVPKHNDPSYRHPCERYIAYPSANDGTRKSANSGVPREQEHCAADGC